MASDQRAEQVAAWDRVAGGWERRNDELVAMTRAVSERMVALLDPQPGESVLELGAGVGDTGYLAAERLGAAGRLISTDFSSGMVEAARRRAAALGLENVQHRVMDATAVTLPDASVDGVLSRFAVMLVPEPERVFAETRRVLRADGGRAVFAVWGDRERNPWATTLGRALLRSGHVPPPKEGEPGAFALADRELVGTLAREAGFAEIDFEDVGVVAEHASFDAYWESVLDMAASSSAIIAALPDDERAAVRAAVEADAQPYRQADGSLRLPGAALVFRLR